jgi:hypothetical protein
MGIALVDALPRWFLCDTMKSTMIFRRNRIVAD